CPMSMYDFDSNLVVSRTTLSNGRARTVAGVLLREKTMSKMKSFLVLVAPVFLILSGCGGGGGSSGSSSSGCGSLNARIFGGEVCNQAARSPVVVIVPIASDGERFLPGGFCSGALVTVNDILTSAHCFVDPIQRG